MDTKALAQEILDYIDSTACTQYDYEQEIATLAALIDRRIAENEAA